MPHYHKLGSIPHKRHTQFRKPNGELIFRTIIFNRRFFFRFFLALPYASTTQIIKTDKPYSVMPEVAEEKMLKHRSFQGFNIKPENDYIKSRKPVLVNNDCHISLAAPSKSMKNYFYKNADADEIIFVHEGSGKLKTQYGELEFSYGDYLVIPRGSIYQIEFDKKDNRLFIVESFSPVRYPKKYLSKYGQLMENSPYCERDIRQPENLQTIDKKGDFLL